MEKQYRLIFKGDLLAGFDPTEIRQRASQRLGASPAQIGRLFSGQAVTLKRGLSIDAAARYARELRLLGMRMHVELDATAPPKSELAAGHCKIVFSGELAPGVVREEVMAAAAERLHANAAQLALLFSGRKTTLKKGLNDEQARRYASRLQGIGMLVLVESEEPAVPQALPAPAPPLPLMPLMPAVPESVARPMDREVGFSHAETLTQTSLMHASDRLHAVDAPSVEIDFTQTMVDHELIATNAQQVLPDMEKTELAGEATLRAYMYDIPAAADPSLEPPRPPSLPVAQLAAIAASATATTDFVHAANVAPIGPKRICAGCGARQTHGRTCAHCGHEFPRELALNKEPPVMAAALLPTEMVPDADTALAKPTRSNRILYAALVAALASLSFAVWRLLR